MKSFVLLFTILCIISSFKITSSSSDRKNKNPHRYKKDSSWYTYEETHERRKKHYSASGTWSKSWHKKKTKLPTPEPTHKPTKTPTPEPTEWPTPEPTEWPTEKPTPSPIRDSCKIGAHTKFDFIVMYDNTCGLKQSDCDEFLEGVGEIISRILDYPSSRVQTLEFQTHGEPEIIIDFDEILLQKRPLEYIQTVRQNGECTEGGKGMIDLKTAVDFAIDQLNPNDDRIDKIVIVSTCMDKNACHNDIIK
eukprot:280199_1